MKIFGRITGGYETLTQTRYTCNNFKRKKWLNVTPCVSVKSVLSTWREVNQKCWCYIASKVLRRYNRRFSRKQLMLGWIWIPSESRCSHWPSSFWDKIVMIAFFLKSYLHFFVYLYKFFKTHKWIWTSILQCNAMIDFLTSIVASIGYMTKYPLNYWFYLWIWKKKTINNWINYSIILSSNFFQYYILSFLMFS